MREERGCMRSLLGASFFFAGGLMVSMYLFTGGSCLEDPGATIDALRAFKLPERAPTTAPRTNPRNLRGDDPRKARDPNLPAGWSGPAAQSEDRGGWKGPGVRKQGARPSGWKGPAGQTKGHGWKGPGLQRRPASGGSTDESGEGFEGIKLGGDRSVNEQLGDLKKDLQEKLDDREDRVDRRVEDSGANRR